MPADSPTAQCSNGHSFDRAKEGYFNLLPVQHKKSQAPGDSKLMLQARRRFLEAGHYRPLVERLNEVLGGCESVLDIGCGEGYYTRSISAAAGLDISKDGVRMSAKTDKHGLYVVGSAYRLPFLDHQFDGGLCVFAPLDWQECTRVLKPGSRFVWVAPRPNHLKELAALVYKTVKPHEAKPPEFSGAVTREALEFSLTLSGPELADLLCMTPYYWSASEEKQSAIAAMPATQVSVAFDVFSVALSAA